MLSVGGTSLTASRGTGTYVSETSFDLSHGGTSSTWFQASGGGFITTGNNTASFPHVTVTGYRAAPGWDPVTGWGSPHAHVLVPLLASYGNG